jgi:hypothetical protein
MSALFTERLRKALGEVAALFEQKEGVRLTEVDIEWCVTRLLMTSPEEMLHERYTDVQMWNIAEQELLIRQEVNRRIAEGIVTQAQVDNEFRGN